MGKNAEPYESGSWEEEAVSLLKELLEIPTVNGRDDEGAAAEYLDAYLKRHGIESQVDRIDSRHANVIGRVRGRDESRTVIWNGHLDTVPYGDLSGWSTDPGKAVIREGRMYARGASDMKSGLAAMAFALAHLPGKPAANIQFLGTCDEEKGGLGAERVLKKGQMAKTDFMLIGEPTDLRPGTAQKGCLWLRLAVRGKTSHGAYPETGANAVEGLFLLAEEIKAYAESFSHPFLGASTAQLNWIAGGGAFNMTADACEAVMDIRMVPGLTCGMVLKAAGEAAGRLAERNPRFSVQFTVENSRRAFEIAQDWAQVKRLKESLRKRGLKEDSIGIRFFTDASVLAEQDLKMNVLLFGPGSPALAHQPDEYVELAAYLQAVEILMEMALEENVRFFSPSPHGPAISRS